MKLNYFYLISINALIHHQRKSLIIIFKNLFVKKNLFNLQDYSIKISFS